MGQIVSTQDGLIKKIIKRPIKKALKYWCSCYGFSGHLLTQAALLLGDLTFV